MLPGTATQASGYPIRYLSEGSHTHPATEMATLFMDLLVMYFPHFFNARLQADSPLSHVRVTCEEAPRK